jgi:multicomponent Na+:H+ antiporter subunit F
VIESVLTATAVLVTAATFLCLYRAVLGPTAADRVVAINVIGTKAVVIISIVSLVLHEAYFLDVAMVYALISFVATVGIAKYLEKGSLE